jgi:hypothetical protein
LSGFVQASLTSQHGRIQQVILEASFRAAAARMADRTKAIIGQCIPVCKARLQRGVAHRCAHAVAVGKPPPAMLDFP